MVNDRKEFYVDAEYRDQIIRVPLNKDSLELYREEDNIPAPIVRVKRITSPTKTERWKIFSNEQVMFIVEGQKLSKKEKEFLRTLPGVNFLISEFKKGFKSLNELRGRLKQII